MKSFFKKLSVVVLAAAMILALVPAMNATAATVSLGPSKAEAGRSFDVLVGDTLNLNFYGAKGYVEKVDSHWVEWSSSNPEVASVDRVGNIKGLKVGSSTISVKVTVSATQQTYTGSAVVNVKKLTKDFDAELVKYVAGKATFELTFASETLAKANEKNIEVSRVRLTKIKRLELKTKTDSVKVDGKKLIVTFPASEGVTYCINVIGTGSVDKLVSTGKPVDAYISCKDVVVATKEDTDPRNNVNNKPSTDIENIVCEVKDENGVVVAEFIGKNTSYVNPKVTSASVVYKNLEKNINITSKTITLNKQGDKAVVKGEFTCKYGNENIKLATNEITVTTVNYQYPSGLDFAYDVHAVDINADKAKIKYDEDCDFTATMNVRESKQIVYVFNATDVNNNTGLYTGRDGYAYCTDANNKVGKLFTKYKFALDPEADHVVVLAADGTMTAVKGGSEYVFIYTDDAKEELAGYLEVFVNEEPVLSKIVLSENYLKGYNNSTVESTIVQMVHVDLFDQNDNPIAVTSVRGEVYLSNTSLTSSKVLTKVKDALPDDTGFDIGFDFSEIPATDDKECFVTDLVLKNAWGEEIKAEISLDSYTLSEEDEEGYVICAKDVLIDNKSLAQYVGTGKKKAKKDELNPTITVYRTLGGIKRGADPFYVMEGIPDGLTDEDGNLIVDIPNYIEYKASKNELSEGIYVGLFKDGKLVEFDCDANMIASMKAPKTKLVYPVVTSELEEESQIITGDFTVEGWLVTQDGDRQIVDTITGTEFTVTKNFTGLEDLEPVYTVDASGNRTQTVAYDPNSCNTDSVKELLASILMSFSGKYDFNYDGKFTGEFVPFTDELFENYLSGFELTEDEYILGADGKTIFIKSVTVYYHIGAINMSESLQINKSFVTNGFKGEPVHVLIKVMAKKR